MFAILDCISDIIKKSLLPERKLGGYVLSGRNHYPGLFLCRNHKHMSNVNRVITNTYFNKEQKKLWDMYEKTILKLSN